jgi:membrane protein YqaA with SNARE-associated domain
MSAWQIFAWQLIDWQMIDWQMIDWHSFVVQYGLWGLGIASFVSATIVPLSSEAILVAGVAVGVPLVPAFWVCSAGNCAACLVNYGMGSYVRHWVLPRLEASKSGIRALAWMERHGTVSLFASWLPFVGDPLTVVAGVVRVRLVWFVIIVFSLRIARYAVAVWGAQAAHLL